MFLNESGVSKQLMNFSDPLPPSIAIKNGLLFSARWR